MLSSSKKFVVAVLIDFKNICKKISTSFDNIFETIFVNSIWLID